ESIRVNEADGIVFDVDIRVDAAIEANGIALAIAPGLRVVAIPEVVVVEVGFPVKFEWKSTVEGSDFLVKHLPLSNGSNAKCCCRTRRSSPAAAMAEEVALKCRSTALC
ncbi:MAG: hypothetical protein L6Q52_13715, partial [Rhodocyclaceae bacterium]|nr:hypothetical protein [Rhodocyclaceae bacterium]